MNLIVNRRKLKSSDTKLLIGIAFLMCVLMAFTKESIFPEKYFFDSYTIQDLIVHTYKDYGDKSFSNTAKFFRYLHIDRYIVAPIISVISYFGGLILIFKKYQVKELSLFNFILMIAYSAMAMVYLSTYSKELIVYLCVVLPFIFFEKKNIFIWLLFVLLYTLFFRSYWTITIGLFLGIKYFLVKKPKLLFLAIPIFYFLIAFIYNYVFGTSLVLIRFLTNDGRDIDMAQTAIPVFIKGSSFILEASNFFVTLIFLIFPIPLIILGKPFYLILAILISAFFYNFLKLYVKQYFRSEFTNIFSFVIAFMLVQSLFEPDYGSFVKHLAPLYPLIFVCIAKNTKFVDEEKAI